MDDLVGFLVVVLRGTAHFNILREATAWWWFSTAHVTTTPTSSMAQNAIFLGEGDLHDTSYDYMEVDTELRSCNITSPDTNEHCSTISVSILLK
jgi:hypothetical protein